MATTTNNGWETPDDTDLVKDGALAIRTALNGVDTSTGTGLLVWQTYAPTLSGGWANGNGTWNAFYCQIGKTVHVRAQFTLGSTTTKGTGCIFSLPVQAKTTAMQPGVCRLAPAGNSTYGIVAPQSTTTAAVLVFDSSATYVTGNTVTATVPGTWATGNTITFSLTYEAN